MFNDDEDTEAIREAVRAAVFARGKRSRTVSDTATMQGSVVYYNEERGFGFLSRDDSAPDLFFHHTAFCGLGEPEQGQRVQFSIVKDPQKGKLKAANIQLIT